MSRSSIMTSRIESNVAVFLLLLLCAVGQTSDNSDQFTYQDEGSTDPNFIYPPKFWDLVRCSDLDKCMGWPDSFDEGIEWELDRNYCRWCPADEDHDCGTHHQSPVNLMRNRALENHTDHNPCIDKHWMAYFDSSCSFNELVKHDAFRIERHALKIIQPSEEIEPDVYRNACKNKGRRYGRIDFSKGFSDWWHLSHTDFHVPSEHTQEGKRYSGEIQMYHFYSVSGEEAGVNNEMASVTVFLEAYPDVPDYDVLNKIICQWRKTEDRTRQQCGLPSVTDEYPGCFFYQRGHETSPANVQPDGGRRHLRTEPKNEKRTLSPYDIIMHNHMGGGMNDPSFKPKILRMNESDYEVADPEFDWDEFIASVYEQEQMSAETAISENSRHLLDYQNVNWTNYFPMIGVKTEYYYRYSGTQTIPPCYGKFTPGTRGFTNHWRVMKDPIRVSQRQIDEMHRIIRERLAPPDDPIRPCQPDTAARPDPKDPSKISVARPLQSTHRAHFMVFCECTRWKSKWAEDQAWCKQRQSKRFYEEPYNFKTDGF